MRRNVHGQLPLVPQFSEHEHARELAEVGRILDESPQLDRLVERDLLRGGISADRGRRGLTAQQVLRAALLKQMRGYSYEELAFHLSDSQAYRAFCRFEVVGPPLKKSTLQENVALLSPATWEKLNELVVVRAKATGIESGKKVRVDCTPVESNIHAPPDSSLLWDVVRVLSRSLDRAVQFVRMTWSDQRKVAKHRYIGIVRAPSAVKRRPLFKRCFGLDRCTWKGFASFHAYVQASVLSANLLLLARHRLA